MISSYLWPTVAGFVYAVFAAFAIALAHLVGRGQARGLLEPRPAALFDVAYIAAASLFIFITRLPILELSRNLQPDEAQYGSNAMSAAVGWLNWDTADIGSSGPLQAMLQAWPLLFGWDITFTTIHITGAVLACAMAACIYLSLRHALGPVYAVVFSLPAVLFLGGVTYFDLVHTTSLYLPITLALFGCLATIVIWRRPNRWLALSAAFALGLIPLVKPQGVVLGLYVGAALVFAHARWETTWRARILRALPVALTAVVPLGLSLAGLVHVHKLDDFVVEVFEYSRNYVQRPPTPIYWLKVMLTIPHLAAMLTLFGAAILVFGWIWRNDWRRSHAFTWFALGFFLFGAVSIMAPGWGNHHYLLFTVAMSPFLAAALTHEVLSIRAWRPRMGAWGPALATAAVALFMFPTALHSAFHSPAIANDGALLGGFRFKSPHLLDFLVSDRQARLTVYGYMPDFYVDAGLASGTRETWSENIIVARPDRDLYRKRFIAELDHSRPAVFVDTVAAGAFLFRDPARQGPQTIPPLAERLSRDYEPISRSSTATGCPEIYLRNDFAARTRSELADILEVTASGYASDTLGAYLPSHVVDRDVFETCIDRWLAPPGKTAWLDLQLAQPERIRRVALLNTRGRYKPVPPGKGTDYRTIYGNVAERDSAQTAVVKLMDQTGVIAEKRVHVDDYPYWTEIDFADLPPARAASHVRIELPDWKGNGTGLNEVAIFREETRSASLSGAKK